MKQYGKLDLRNCDCMELMRDLEDKSQHLIIVDPPYFEIKGEFDFAWKSFDDYLSNVEVWAKECRRTLADNGTVLWWGNTKRISYTQIILDKYFHLENSLVWEKIDSMQTQYYSPDAARSFITHTERLLMYSNDYEPSDWNKTGLERVKLDINNFGNLREYFKKFQESLGLSKSQIIQAVGQQADHCFRWGSTQWDLPTRETYSRLCSLPLKHGFVMREYEDLRKEYEDQRKEYEDLRKEYEDQRRYFQNDLRLSDVLKFSQESSETQKHDHPTQKAPTMTLALVRTCSKPGQSCLIPFAGSGTEVVAAYNHGLSVNASELDADYYAAMMERVGRETAQQELF